MASIADTAYSIVENFGEWTKQQKDLGANKCLPAGKTLAILRDRVGSMQ